MTNQLNAPCISILQQEREKAYSEGWGQASQVSYDNAHEAGRGEGFIEGRLHNLSLFPWAFVAGVIFGGGAAWLML